MLRKEEEWTFNEFGVERSIFGDGLGDAGCLQSMFTKAFPVIA